MNLFNTVWQWVETVRLCQQQSICSFFPILHYINVLNNNNNMLSAVQRVIMCQMHCWHIAVQFIIIVVFFAQYLLMWRHGVKFAVLQMRKVWQLNWAQANTGLSEFTDFTLRLDRTSTSEQWRLCILTLTSVRFTFSVFTLLKVQFVGNGNSVM